MGSGMLMSVDGKMNRQPRPSVWAGDDLALAAEGEGAFSNAPSGWLALALVV
ncbi:MAG: hypothetical protein HFACDABA_02614 [Anaerolineales bacterium]|nr:hypothetical protein [Anaerolineales bacterium]